MSPLNATKSNLALLPIVSVWRVWLMTRVVRTLFSTGSIAAWSVVLLFADPVALVAIVVTPMPIISIMGGMSDNDAETVIFGCFVASSALIGGVGWDERSESHHHSRLRS